MAIVMRRVGERLEVGVVWDGDCHGMSMSGCGYYFFTSLLVGLRNAGA